MQAQRAQQAEVHGESMQEVLLHELPQHAQQAKQALHSNAIANLVEKALSDDVTQQAQQAQQHPDAPAKLLKNTLMNEMTQHDVQSDLISSYSPAHSQVCLHASFCDCKLQFVAEHSML